MPHTHGAVRAELGHTLETGTAGQVDNDAAARTRAAGGDVLGLHLADLVLHAEEDAAGVDVLRAVKDAGVRVLDEGDLVAGHDDTSRVDRIVDTTKRSDRLRNGGLDVGLLGHVAAHEDGRAGVCAVDLGHRLVSSAACFPGCCVLTSSPSLVLISATAILAPRSANARAAPAPRPLEPPVMKATPGSESERVAVESLGRAEAVMLENDGGWSWVSSRVIE